jgi:hypothetical protein
MSRAKTQLWAAAVASHISSLSPYSSFIEAENMLLNKTSRLDKFFILFLNLI